MLQRQHARRQQQDQHVLGRDAVLCVLCDAQRSAADGGRRRAVSLASSPFQLVLTPAPSSYARQWRYHKELGVWLTKDPGTEPTEKGPNYERGTYIIFDPAVFSRVETLKDFTLHYDSLEDRPVVVPQSSLGQPVAQQGQAQAQDGKR